MKSIRLTRICLVTAVVGGTIACQQQPQQPVDTRAANELALRNAFAQALQAAQAKDVERVLSFYADDAALLPAGAPMAIGKQAIRRVWSQMAANPGVTMHAQLIKLEVSRAGDLGYFFGTYELRVNEGQGQLVARGASSWRCGRNSRMALGKLRPSPSTPTCHRRALPRPSCAA